MPDDTTREVSRSPAYPTFDIEQALASLGRLHAKDRWTPIPLPLAGKHLGYAGLNGASRAIFATLKQYGFISYKGEGQTTLLVMTDLAKKALGNQNDHDRDEAKRVALGHPRTYQEVKKVFGDWDQLPSSERLVSMLEMKYGFSQNAATTFDKVLRRNLSLIAWKDAEPEPAEPEGEAAQKMPEQTISARRQVEEGLQHLIMPGHSVYLAIPAKMEPDEAKRVLMWLRSVVDPTIRFAGGMFEEAA